MTFLFLWYQDFLMTSMRAIQDLHLQIFAILVFTDSPVREALKLARSNNTFA